MSLIAQRLGREPAAVIGLLASLLLLVIALVSDPPWDAQTIIGIIAPVASALGIRQLVSPAAGPRPLPAPEPAAVPKPKPRERK